MLGQARLVSLCVSDGNTIAGKVANQWTHQPTVITQPRQTMREW